MMVFTARAALVAALVSMAVALPAVVAQGDMDSMAPEGTAIARVIHASPDSPAVDVWIDGALAIEGLAFGEATDYVELAAGTHGIQVVPAGAMGPVVLETQVTLDADTAYSISAIGKLEELSALAIADAPMLAGAHVRFVHASPDAPAVDLAPTGGMPIFSDVAFGESTGYATLPAGTYDLEARLAGTDTVALDVSGVELEGGAAYTAIAIGSAADGTLSVKLLEDSAT